MIGPEEIPLVGVREIHPKDIGVIFVFLQCDLRSLGYLLRRSPQEAIQDNWSIRKHSKLLKEIDAGSLPLQPELSVYFKSPVLKIKEDPLKFYRDNYNHKIYPF
ncbi:hypothetical protein NPIL_607481 [Nephila pilipes]|uniref:Uncharacterized protein n=1 Tax=Nephila pilipes TaxID=299642 RepID=A0A8X6P1N6_NEPPI|nr:hypothetical protein NPIL_607481 [Nephila pilipes]